MTELKCFKAYDIRGRVPEELNDDLVYLIGRGFAETTNAKTLVVGRDVRETSTEFHKIMVKALTEAGVDVYDIGMCASEEVYFATFNGGYDGGVMITASHNPAEFNGMKMVKKGAAPVDENDFAALKKWVSSNLNTTPAISETLGSVNTVEGNREAYVEHLLTYVDTSKLKPLKLVVNAGNGPAGLYIDLLEKHLPVEFIKMNHEPDASFPNGIPNPVLVEQREATADMVKQHNADMGIAWDGDADRCCLFDAEGNYVNAYYIVGLLAQSMLARTPGQTIVSEPRLNWNTAAIAEASGGTVVQSRVGHGYIKAKMREANALFGGEASGHYFFKQFASCDSGMIPWLLIAAMMSETGKTLNGLVQERYEMFPASDEINFNVGDVADTLLETVENQFKDRATTISKMDGLGMEFDNWRFSLRQSQNEPWLVRVNVEARGDETVMIQQRDALLQFIEGLQSK